MQQMAGLNRFTLLLLLYLGIVSSSIAQTHYAGISAAQPTGSAGIATDGLVAAYDFETYTQDGLLRDFSSRGNHGKVTQTVETDGQFGKARVFAGMKDVVDLPEDMGLDLSGPLTIATWIKFAKPNLHQHILSCDDIYVLWTTERDQFRFADTRANGFTTQPGTVKAESWHSVVAVLNATRGDALSPNNIKIYVDGTKLDGTHQPAWEPKSLRPNGCLIGASVATENNHPAGPVEGVIDELAVFSRALSEQEIQAFSNKP